MKFHFTSQPIDKLDCELLVLMHYENQVPFHGLLGLIDWRLNGRLSQLVIENHFSGKAKEMILMPAEHRFRAQKMILLGLGQHEHFRENHISQVFDYTFETIDRLKAKQIALSLNPLIPSQFEWRNSVRMFVSKAFDFPQIEEVILCEPQDWVMDAKRRHMDFGGRVEVSFE